METREIIIENKSGETFTVLVDTDDYERVNQHKWYVNWDGKRLTRYAVTNVPHPSGENYSKGTQSENVRKQAKLLMHRFIAKTPKGLETDHINGNPFDNRKSNLRILTSQRHRMIGAAYNEGNSVRSDLEKN